jgi:DNA binding protein with HTH domain
MKAGTGSREVQVEGSEKARGPRSTDSTSRTSDRLVAIELAIKIPPGVWYGEFSRRYPELVIESTNVAPVGGNETIGEFEIFGPPEDWTTEILRFRDAVEAARLDVQPDRGSYRVRYHLSPLLALAVSLEVLVRYPRTIKNGIIRCEIIAWRSQMRRLVEILTRAGDAPRLLSLRRDSPTLVTQPHAISLTPNQRALFHEALASGYYDVPRRITLTQLANRVSRNKSSVSKMLHRVQQKLAEFAATAGV